MNYEQIIIRVDNFFDNPHKLRERTLELSYQTPPSQLYSNARGPVAEYTSCDLASRETLLQKIARFWPGAVKSAATEFRYIHAGTIKRQICHADGTDMAGIVHLTLPEHCQGGTVFFRHKPTGDCWLHPERQALYNFGDATQWEELYREPMAFNRMAYYPGRLFHAVGMPYFGDTIRNARLTMNFFVDLQDRTPVDRLFDKAAMRLKKGKGNRP